jgi:hypothetical protein
MWTISMRFVTAVGVLVLSVPASVDACAVCGLTGTRDNGFAYLAMTVVMSGLPLAMIGGVVFWVYRRTKTQA